MCVVSLCSFVYSTSRVALSCSWPWILVLILTSTEMVKYMFTWCMCLYLLQDLFSYRELLTSSFIKFLQNLNRSIYSNLVSTETVKYVFTYTMYRYFCYKNYSHISILTRSFMNLNSYRFPIFHCTPTQCLLEW